MTRSALLTLLAVGASVATGSAMQAGPTAVDAVGVARPMDFRTTPPPPSHDQDPADSLYRAARGALNGNDYRRAANLFRQITTRHPRSAYAADAFYWEAFALYRLGGTENLRAAITRLDEQGRQHPRAGTRGDANALATRIRGSLAREGDSDAAERVTRQASRAAQSCPDEDEDMRAAALNALLQMNTVQAVPILQQVLARRDACSEPLREKAVFLLSQKRTAQTEETLLDVARNDPSSAVREKAVFWLSEIPTERAVAVLEQILRSSTDSGLREKAIFALSQHRSPRASELIRAAAEQESLPEEVREKAIFWLHEKNTAENAAFLRGLYTRLRSDELKERVLFSLAEMDGQGNSTWLLGVVNDEREPVKMRKKALFWASESGVPVAEIAGLYDRITDREVREQVIFALSQRRDRGAVDKLIDIARGERDPALRKKAIFWLSESNDPRAAEVLLEIIR